MGFDVSAFRVDGKGPATQELAGVSGGDTVEGLDKLVQRFTLQLMSRKNEVPFSSNSGCDFCDRIALGRVATESDIFVAFAASLGQVVTALRAEELAEDSDDEKLGRVRLLGMTMSTAGTLFLHLTLVSVSGNVRDVDLRLDFVIA
jgi:hypothetical protein